METLNIEKKSFWNHFVIQISKNTNRCLKCIQAAVKGKVLTDLNTKTNKWKQETQEEIRLQQAKEKKSWSMEDFSG